MFICIPSCLFRYPYETKGGFIYCHALFKATTCMTFTKPELEAIVISFYSSSVLSLLGSSFTIVTFLIFKEARNPATYLIFSLALADLCSAIGSTFLWIYVINHEDNIYCKVQAGFQMFGLCASVAWGLIIGIYLFLAIYKDVDMEYLGKLRVTILTHMLAWGYASALTIIPYIYNEYGILFRDHRFSWCSIEDPQSTYRTFLYIIDMGVFVILIVLYYLIRHRLQNVHNSAAKIICNKMNIYLLAYALINLPAIVNRVQNFWSQNQIFELFLIEFITQPLQGFMNAIAYPIFHK
eukprot:Phypoly_transcript_11651.p1 GENE.Phypoly_transcript_11651~~Phypoly_transcript_11651.p1  ORF type:complete len:295 (+),score=-1.18 Phypoly_transcript_11651:3-887(+)